jgi:multiple sugar transport system substrate-binding protein
MPTLTRTSQSRPVLGVTPEGPYESRDGDLVRNLANSDAGDFLELFEELQREAARLLSLSPGQREMRMITHLVRSHLAARLVTSSSLAAASGLSYGTAIRTITRMDERGLIVRRTRTSSGKSVSLHPSAELLARWHEFAYRANRRVLAALEPQGQKPPTEVGRGSLQQRTCSILPPPPVLSNKVRLSRGLRVLVHADPTFTAMRTLKRQFEMILGTPIRSRALSIDPLKTEVTENSRMPQSKYDIVAIDYPWFGEMASNGYLRALNDLVAELGDDLDDFLPRHPGQLTFSGRPIRFARNDVGRAARLSHRSLGPRRLGPPRTVSQTLETARRLHDPTSGISGIAWNGGRGTPLGHSFIMIMSAFGKPVLNLRRTADGFDAERVDGEEMRPMFLSLEARQTVEYLLELMQYSPPNVLSMNWYDRAVAYQRGKVALAYSHTMLAPLYECDPTSPAYRKTGYVPHPTGPRGQPIAPMGGYALAIPANLAAERLEGARVALRCLTSASAIKLYMVNGSLASPRVSVSRDPEVQAISPLVAAMDDMVADGYVRMWPRPPVPAISDVIGIAGQEVHDLLSGTKSIGASLRDAQNRADARMRELGYY